MSETEGLVKLDPNALSLSDSPKIVEWLEQIEIHESLLPDCIVTDDTTAMDAADRAKEAHEFIKEIEEQRKLHVAPLNDVVKQINGQCKPLTDRLKVVKAGYVGKVNDFKDEQERIAEEARKVEEAKAEAARKAAEAAAAADDDIGFEAAAQEAEDAEATAEAIQQTAVPKSTPASFGRISTSKYWAYEIVDERKLPRLYLMVNEAMLKGAAKAKPQPPEIPGIKWVQKRRGGVR